jgi:hypothetical protein
MAFVRTRKKPHGPDEYGDTISTTLLEAYRENGRVRQRILANLHGEPDTLSALAKLAAMRADLREERKALAENREHANEFYRIVTQTALQGGQYSAVDRESIDKALRERDRLLKRMTQVDAMLAVIERDGPAIKKHCKATPAEIQTAIRKYKRRVAEAEAEAEALSSAAVKFATKLAIKQHVKEAKAMRRLSLRSRKT